MLKYLKLKTKLLTTVFLITCIASIATTAYAIYFFSEKIQQEAQDKMRNNLQVAELIYANQVSKIQDMAGFLSNDSTLQSLSFFGIQQKLEPYLHRLLQRERIDQVLVLDGKRHQIIGNAYNERYGNPDQQRDFTQHPLTQAVLDSQQSQTATEWLDNADTPLLTITAVAPIFKDGMERELFGVVLVRYILNENSQLLDKIGDLLGVSAVILRDQQVISQSLLGGDSLPDLDQLTLQQLHHHRSLQQAHIEYGGQLLAYQALLDNTDTPVAVLSLSVPADKYVDTTLQAALHLLGIMLLCIAGATLLGFALARSILNPIKELLEGVKRITSGDLAYKIKLDMQDELGVLADAFNGMACQLEEFFKVLKSTVNTLTRVGNALSSEKNLNNLLEIFVSEARHLSHADGGTLYTLENKELQFKIMQSHSQNLFMRDTSTDLNNQTLAQAAQLKFLDYQNRNKDVVSLNSLDNKLPIQITDNDTDEHMLIVPLQDRHDQTIGVLQLLDPINPETQQPMRFSDSQMDIISALASQAAVAIENARSYEKIKAQNVAFERFVPTEFLEHLGKDAMEDIQLGDASLENMTVLFSDIRDFTTLSEPMPAEEVFHFLNDYLKFIGPCIVANGGFIDKYIGDAIMALFAGNRVSSADDAVAGALGILQELHAFNHTRTLKGEAPIKIGIGLHTGALTLGTIGFEGRLETTVIGDTVNMAARVQSLTKHYGIYFGMTALTYQSLTQTEDLLVREVDTVQVKGKSQASTIYDVFNLDPEPRKTRKLETLSQYEHALELYKERQWSAAQSVFEELQQVLFDDRVVQIYIERCAAFQHSPPLENWNGVTRLDAK